LGLFLVLADSFDRNPSKPLERERALSPLLQGVGIRETLGTRLPLLIQMLSGIFQDGALLRYPLSTIACVASVSVEFGSKELQREKRSE